jgi:hypothetical protein
MLVLVSNCLVLFGVEEVRISNEASFMCFDVYNARGLEVQRLRDQLDGFILLTIIMADCTCRLCSYSLVYNLNSASR